MTHNVLAALGLVFVTAGASDAARTASVVPNAGQQQLASVAEHTAPSRVTCSSYPCPGGLFWYYFTDPGCPNSPDTFQAYVEYWNEDATFAYDVYAGNSTYVCTTGAPDYTGIYVEQTLSSGSVWPNCQQTSPWGCQNIGFSWSGHP